VVPRLEAKHLDLDAPHRARTIGHGDVTVVSLGDTTITRELLHPGWRWSNDVKPIVGTELCRANHQIYVVSGRLHVLMDDGAELDVEAGDAVTIPAGHDAWVVGDEPCECIDFSPVYSHLIDAGEAYRHLTDPARPRHHTSRKEAAARLRAKAAAGGLDSAAVEIVLGAVGHRPRRRVTGPAGLTPREMEVLMLIATGAATKQAAYALGITPKTAATHVERIYSKTGVSSRAEVTRFAIQHGLVSSIGAAD
jgi:DNA-binding CsgD family transcriptional regulator